MNDKEAIEMMQRAHDEIVGLRKRIDQLEPKAAAYETISAIIGLLPRPSQGMSEDLTWRLRQRIAELKQAEKVSASVEAGGL